MKGKWYTEQDMKERRFKEGEAGGRGERKSRKAFLKKYKIILGEEKKEERQNWRKKER